ncbi:uncharacterized protein LOC126370733 [Pectinophora gossypiella]|uniref:uncharacterized protein LOC126370733 n=1 Tax=Pectinophora gossypiella TaxID=13191 RepID=UPI00214EFC6B|nr:uncharacterized protein LOC126370733 [Pectinophora gossypiella]
MYWYVQNCLLFAITVSLLQTVASEISMSESGGNCSEVSNLRTFSRRKRFLVFPEASSLQLVFCCQTSALIPIGDIFLYGNTAALAWTLPTDPDFLTMFKKHEKSQRRQDTKEIYYLDANGKLLAKVPYKRKPIINPAFAKRSVDEQKTTFKEKLKIKLDRMKMHEKQKSRQYLKSEYMDEKSVNFHRHSRVGLYEKLEKLFTALGNDGKQCVLYKLCESARSRASQGTFLQELERIVFTLPKGVQFAKEEHKDYDKAHHDSKTDDCSTLYPGCEGSIIPV